jgi:hypothetical protein
VHQVSRSGVGATAAPRKRWTLLALGVLTTLLFAATLVERFLGGWRGLVYQTRLLYLEQVPPVFWPRTEFTPEAWTATPQGERHRFAKGLVGSRRLLGLTSSEVANLLGGPTSETQAVYPLRRAGVQNLWWVLVVEFQNGHVARVRRGIAFLDP